MPTKQQTNPFFNATGFRRSLNGNDNSLENLNTIQGRNVRLDNPAQWIGTIDFQKERLGIYKKTDYLTYKSPASVLIDPLLLPRTSLTNLDYSTATILKEKYEHARILELVARNHKDIETKHEIHFQFKNLRRPTALNLDWLFWFCESGSGHNETLRLIDDAGHWSSMGSRKDFFDFQAGEYSAGYREIKKINNGNASLFNVKVHSVNNIVDYRPINGFVNPLTDFPATPINGDAFVALQNEIIAPINSVLSEPPAGISIADRYLVDVGATGAWRNHVGQIATAIDTNTWAFEDPEDGQMVLKTAQTPCFYQLSLTLTENISQKDSTFQIRTNYNEQWDDLFALYLTFAEMTTVKKITLYPENITVNATYNWRLTKNSDPNIIVASGTINLVNSEENAQHCFHIYQQLQGDYTLFIDVTKTEGQGQGCTFEYGKSTTSGRPCGKRDAATKEWIYLPDLTYPQSGIVSSIETIEWDSVSTPFLGELEEIPSTGRINGSFPTNGDILFSQKRRSYFIAEAGWGLIDFVQVDPQEDNYWAENKIFNSVKIIDYDPTTSDASGLYYCVGETDDAYKGKFVEIVQNTSRTEYAVPEDALLIVSATCSEENFPVGVYYHKGRRTAPLNPIQPNGLEYETIVYSFSESMIFCGSYDGVQDPNTYTSNENVFIRDSGNNYYLRYLWRPLWIKDFVYTFRHGQWHVLFPDRPGGMIKGVDFIVSKNSTIHQFRPILAQIDGDCYIIPDTSDFNHRQPVKASLFKTGVYDTSRKIGFKYLDLSSYDISLDIIAEPEIWENLWKGSLFQNPFSWTAVHFVVKGIGTKEGTSGDGRFLEHEIDLGQNYQYFYERQGQTITVLPYLTRPGLTTIILDNTTLTNHNCEFTFGSTYDSGEPIDTVFGYASDELRWRKTAVYINGIELDLDTIDYNKYSNGDRFLIESVTGNKFYRVEDNNSYEQTQEFDSNSYYIVHKIRDLALFEGRNESYKYFIDYYLLFFSMAELKNLSIDKRQIYGQVILRDSLDFMNQVLNLIIMIFCGGMGFSSAAQDKRWVSALNPASWGRQIRQFSFGAINKPADGAFEKECSIAFDWLLMAGDPNSHRLLERLGQSGNMFAKSMMTQNFFTMSQISFGQSTLNNNAFTQNAMISSGFSQVAPLLNNLIIFNPNDPDDENLDRVKGLSGMEPLITMLIPTETATDPIEVLETEYVFEKGYVYLPKIPGFGQTPIFEKGPVMPGMFGFSMGKPVMFNGEFWDENFFATSRNIQNMPLLTLFNSTVIITRHDPSLNLPVSPNDWQIFVATSNGNGWVAGQTYIYFPSAYHTINEDLVNGYLEIEFSIGTRIYDMSGKVIFVQKIAGWQLEEFYNVIDVLPEPPNNPADGDRYLVSDTPTIGEAWEGLANLIMVYNLDEAAWMPISLSTIPEGMDLYVQEKGCQLRKVGQKWVDFIGHQASSAPESPSQGQLYWDTDDETWYRWSGSAWIQVSGSGQAAGEINKYVLAVQTSPPGSPIEGDRYIVKPMGSGAWAGHDNEIATWDDGASQWVFTPTPLIINGTSVYSAADTALYTWSGSAWVKHDHDGVHADLVDGKVPISQLPDTIISGMEYKGSHDCSTEAYPTNPDKGDYYICSVAGTISGTNYQVGDWLVYNGSGWDKIDNTNEDAVLLTGNQTIAGVKTFSSIPLLPASDPESDNQATRKSFVDGKITQTITDGVTTKAPSEDAVFDALAGKAGAAHGHGNISTDGKIGASANLPLITTTDGAVTTGQFGTNANTFCQGNDGRLSDARTPTTHGEDKHSTISQNTIKGRISSGTGQVEDLTAENVRSIINVENGANNYIHPTTAGNKHVPTGGAANQLLVWDSEGTAKWVNPDKHILGQVIDIRFSPPASPTTGDRYLLDRDPTGAWADHGNEIAEYTGSGWSYTVPVQGTSVVVASENSAAIYDGSDWVITGLQKRSGWPITATYNVFGDQNITLQMSTHKFQITSTNGNFRFYWNGYKVFRDVSSTPDEYDLEYESDGLIHLYYDGSDPSSIALCASAGYNFYSNAGNDKSVVHVVTIYKRGSTYLLGYDPHTVGMAFFDHLLGHIQSNFKYGGGFVGTFGATSLGILSGIAYDEDILFMTTNLSNVCLPVVYRNSGTWTYQSATSGRYYYLYDSNRVQFDNSGTLTNADENKYVNMWILFTPIRNFSAGGGVIALMGQKQHAALNDALVESFSEISLDLANANFITNEPLPLYRVTLKSAATVEVVAQRLVAEVYEKVTPSMLNNAKYLNAQWDPSLGSDHSYSGNTAPLVVGESVVFGNPLYFDGTDGEWKIADADVANGGALPAQAIALESKSDGQTCLCLMNGFIRDDSWSFTSGDAVFVTTGKGLSTTPPAGSGEFIQAVGTATGTNKMYFNPELTIREV